MKSVNLTLEQIRSTFQAIDLDGNGEISQIEFIKALRRDPQLAETLGLPSKIQQESESRVLFQAVFHEIDVDESKTITMEEFTHFYQPQPMNGGIAEMDTTAAEAVPGAVPFAWGHMTLSTDAQGKVRVAAAAPPVAAGDEHRPEVGDLVLAVDDTHAGIANDPRAVLESILRDAAASGQRTLRLTLARPSPDSGSGWLTFSCDIPVKPQQAPRRKNVAATCEELEDLFFEMDTGTVGRVTAEQFLETVSRNASVAQMLHVPSAEEQKEECCRLFLDGRVELSLSQWLDCYNPSSRTQADRSSNSTQRAEHCVPPTQNLLGPLGPPMTPSSAEELTDAGAQLPGARPDTEPKNEAQGRQGKLVDIMSIFPQTSVAPATSRGNELDHITLPAPQFADSRTSVAPATSRGKELKHMTLPAPQFVDAEPAVVSVSRTSGANTENVASKDRIDTGSVEELLFLQEEQRKLLNQQEETLEQQRQTIRVQRLDLEQSHEQRRDLEKRLETKEAQHKSIVAQLEEDLRSAVSEQQELVVRQSEEIKRLREKIAEVSKDATSEDEQAVVTSRQSQHISQQRDRIEELEKEVASLRGSQQSEMKNSRLREHNLLHDALQEAQKELMALRTRASEDAAEIGSLKGKVDSKQREAEQLRKHLESSTLANQEWEAYCADLKAHMTDMAQHSVRSTGLASRPATLSNVPVPPLNSYLMKIEDGDLVV